MGGLSQGIDVYSGNEPIDWGAVRAAPQSIQFVGIKLGEGTWTGYPLDIAIKQYDGSLQAGIPYRFWYTYAHPEYSPVEQAAYAKQRAGSRLGEWPLARDYEDTDQPWCKPQSYTSANYATVKVNALRLFNWINDDLKAHDDAFGRLTTLYTGSWWINWMMEVARIEGWDTAFIISHKLWNAAYTANELLPIGWSSSWIWQYSSSGTVSGIPTRCDMNAIAKETLAPGPAPEPQPASQVQIVHCYILAAHKSASLLSLPSGWFRTGDITPIVSMASDSRGVLWIQTGKGWIKSYYTQKVN